jgi:hypothetical protein
MSPLIRERIPGTTTTTTFNKSIMGFLSELGDWLGQFAEKEVARVDTPWGSARVADSCGKRRLTVRNTAGDKVFAAAVDREKEWDEIPFPEFPAMTPARPLHVRVKVKRRRLR